MALCYAFLVINVLFSISLKVAGILCSSIIVIHNSHPLLGIANLSGLGILFRIS